MKKPSPSSGTPRELSRRTFLGGAAVASTLVALDVQAQPSMNSTPPATPRGPAFELEEATLAGLQADLTSGKHTAHGFTERYLARIQEIDKGGTALGSVIELNPDALAIAAALDAEREAKGLGARCTAFPCSSRTTSGRRTRCRPPRARSRSWAPCPRGTRSWWSA
ncbi:hypothetical protein ACN28S_11715 [Cystobacter fuscus]